MSLIQNNIAPNHMENLRHNTALRRHSESDICIYVVLMDMIYTNKAEKDRGNLVYLLVRPEIKGRKIYMECCFLNSFDKTTVVL